MNGSIVRTAEERARTWRMRQWPNDPTVAHLVFVDHLTVPDAEAIDAAVVHARRRGARAVRTSALLPRAADPVLEAGFEPIDRLALMRRDVTDLTDLTDLVERGRPGDGSDRIRTRPLMPWHHGAAAAVDRAAFGPLWGNDAASLRDIRHATPHHRARQVRRHGELAGFVISGAAGRAGYVQRLAVSPGHRRAGIARALVIDALRWMRDRRLDSALVNTGRDNDAALALYAGLGFVRLDDELIIAELRLDG